ncbi:MAG TPA: sarcosine oxidase subunit alpha family protein [Steroidobacteraceae bacterium]|nr:sarcosine oxidase subunit alpha family protein [Steroidobacteraceae bacterium]
MSQRFRAAASGAIDRARLIVFHFDGRAYEGHAGDTLASALLANGVHLVARSFKYHRPRGILSAGAEEPNALVTVRRDAARLTPNVRATQLELYPGLEAYSQNRWPSLKLDTGALANLLSPFLPAGFYYKTFMWPRRAWHALYEPSIRRAAGLGRAPALPDPDIYAQRFAHCDVLVVGAGPAGLAAAGAAAASGARVVLCDEQSELGGSLLGEPLASSAALHGRSARDFVAAHWQRLAANERVTLLPRTTAFGYFPHNFVALCERLTDHLAAPAPAQARERLWQVRAREVVLATGAIERPLVFPGNDRPGIMLAGAARTYLHRFGVLAGTRAVLVTATDEGYRAAIDLNAAGIEIAAIADLRDSAQGALPEAARRAGIRVRLATAIGATRGRQRVRAVQLVALNARGAPVPGEWLECDLVLMSGGFTPSVHLFSQSRGKLAWSEALQSFLPAQAAERVRSAGACRGVFALEAVIEDGASAGAAAAQAARATGTHPAVLAGADVAGRAGDAAAAVTPGAAGPSAVSPLPPLEQLLPCAASAPKAFVDLQHDVTTRDLALATREGFRSIEHVKRYTTTGMATDQGKTSNLNALAVVARELARPVPAVGLTTFRMPYTPVSFGSFAGYARGQLFDPVRTTPMHGWAERQGAVFEDVGLWKRARYFPQGGQTLEEAVARECRAVRGQCGIFDASTLGKIELVGPDAVEFLNRLYVNAWSSLAVGRCRYGILLRDDGFVYDDGVIARIAPDRFHVTTTTGGAARVFALMEDYRQTEWPQLRVWLTSTTEQWAVIALQGPRARDVLQGLVEGIDLAPQALPHMSVAAGHICGVPLRLFRVSFTGELGFELNVPADHGLAVWEALFAAGQAHGIGPYGTEAMHVLRAEKGYIIVGQDTDGTVTPDDAGLSWAIGKNKPDFLGKRALQRSAMRAADRKQLVGLLTEDPHLVLEEGAQVMAQPGLRPPTRPIGHVTSSYYSCALGRSIALALIAGGRGRVGEMLHVPLPGQEVPVRVSAPVFYDPEGARLHG